MFKIRYFAPYTQSWRVQTVSTKEEAEKMIAFYVSCGSTAYLI